MKTSIHLLAFSFWTLCAIAPIRAEFPGKQPFPGVTYESETRTDPPNRLFVTKVNLGTRNLRLEVAPGGADPDGPGQWETTLMRPTDVAAREGFDLVINGDFFNIRSAKQATQSAPPAKTANHPEYQSKSVIWADAVGPAVSNGRTWSTTKEPHPCLVVRKNGKVTIEDVTTPSADAQSVIAGNTMIVDDGKAVEHQNKKIHPRTVLGLDRKGKTLTILTVDGRRPGISVGMSYEELAKEMLRLGCWDAVNLDGGGSTILAMRDPKGGEYKTLNTPSDGRERPVANVLGIKVNAKSPGAKHK